MDSELSDFITYLLEEVIEEQLWEVWVNKDIDKSFEDFKKQSIKKTKKKKKLTEDEEKAILERADAILNIQVNNNQEVSN